MISQFEQLHHEVTDPRKFLGFLLASLYFKGIDSVTVTKEQAEDDVWSAVELQAWTNYDDQSWTFKFKVRGFPMPRRTPTPKAEAQPTRVDLFPRTVPEFWMGVGYGTIAMAVAAIGAWMLAR